MHRYVLFPGLFIFFGSPQLSGLAGALSSKLRMARAPSCSSLHVPADIRRCTCSRTQWTQLFPVLRHNTVQPWLSFRHRACYRVIALLINVSPSQDNGLVFTVRFSRLAMRDIQWCNLLSVYYALRGSPLGTLFPGSSQDTHLSMYHLFIYFIHFTETDQNYKCYKMTTNCSLHPVVH